jgi:hypothetical protein
MLRRIIVPLTILLLAGSISHAQPVPNDTAKTIKFQVSAGGGYLYENLGGILSAQLSYDHFVIASRISSMMSDDDVFAPFETRDFPSENITDYALMAGYGSLVGMYSARMHSRKYWPAHPTHLEPCARHSIP